MGKKFFKILLFIIIVALILSIIGLTIFMVAKDVSFDEFVKMLEKPVENFGEYKQIPLTENIFDISSCENAIGYTTKYKLFVLNEDGDVINEFSSESEMLNISSNENIMVFYNDELNEYYYYIDDNTINEIKINDILNCTITKNDIVISILDSHDGYASGMVLYDIEKDKYIEVNYSDKYILYADTFDNGEKYAINTIDVTLINKTYIDVYSVYNSTPIAGIEVEGNYPILAGLENGFSITGETGAIIFNNEGEMVETIDDNIFISINDVFISSKNGKNYIKRLSVQNGLEFESLLDFVPISMDTLNNLVLIYNKKNIVILDEELNELYKINNYSMIDKVFFLNEKTIGIKTEENILLYKFE